MLKSAIFILFDAMCIAILLSFTTIVGAQRAHQEDYYSRSVEHDSLSYDHSRSATILWFVQSKQNFVWENGQVLAALAGLNFQVQI